MNTAVRKLIIATFWIAGGCASSDEERYQDEGRESGEESSSDDDDGGPSGGGIGEGLDVYVNGSCLVDADCGPFHHCTLGVCTEGCRDDDACGDGLECDPHGRCVGALTGKEPAVPLPARGALVLEEDVTILEPAAKQASIGLHNESPDPVRFRLEVDHPAVVVDPGIRVLSSNETFALEVAIDWNRMEAHDHELTVLIESDAGTLIWRILVPPDRTGHYRGTMAFGVDPYLGDTDVELNLVFADQGIVTGQIFADGSMLWPTDVGLSGTWDPSGAVHLEWGDIVEDDRDEGKGGSPLNRPVGREVVLDGVVDLDTNTVEGEVAMYVSGLADELVRVEGTFALNHAGALRPSTTVTDWSDSLPLPTPVNDWLAGTDEGACEGLGVSYGVPATLGFSPSASCDACAPGLDAPTCEPRQANACASHLLHAGYQLEKILPEESSGDLVPPDPVLWEQCFAQGPAVYDPVTQATCYDREAVRCAGALVRAAIRKSSLQVQEVAATHLADQIAAETAAGRILGAEHMVRAAFAYRGGLVGSALSVELAEIERAQALVMRGLEIVNAPGFLRTMTWMGRDELIHDRHGNDFRRAAGLAARYGELLTLRMRLEHRAGEGDPVGRQEKVRSAALASHLLGIYWSHAYAVNGVEDAFEELSLFGENVGSLSSLHDELGSDRNPYGYSASYVPILVTPRDLAEGRSNFGLMLEAARDEVAQYAVLAERAEQAEDEFWSRGWDVRRQVEETRARYDEQLLDLCGVASNGIDPAVSECGLRGGFIYERMMDIEAARLEIEQAALQVSSNDKLIQIEEDRMRQIIENHTETEGLLDAEEEGIWKVMEESGKMRSAARESWARKQCSLAVRHSMINVADVVADGIVAVAGSNVFAMPLVAGATAAKAAIAVNRGGLQCDGYKADAGLQDGLEDADHLEKTKLTLANQKIDEILRNSQLQQRIIDSEAVVAGMRLKTHELALHVRQRELEATRAVVAWSHALKLAAALISRRDRSVALLEDNPDNPRTSPKFLRARLELGQNVLFWRELAARRTYLAVRALEYEINRTAANLRNDLLQARAPFEFEQTMTCLDHIFENYRLAAGSPQQYVTEISLREDILHLEGPTVDPVTGDVVKPEDRLRAILKEPNHRRRDGTLELPFVVSLGEDRLFAAAWCDDRIESLQVKVVGDFLGDREIDVVLVREAGSQLRSCEDVGSLANQVRPYRLGSRSAAIQAGANDYGLADPNGAFAGWPVAGERWVLAVPTIESSPANADFSLDDISDVVFKVTHRALTVGQSGVADFEPVCR